MKLSKLIDCRNWPIFLLRVGLLVCVMVVNSTASMALRTADFTISHLGKAEGLDNQRIFSVCQSSSGAIWWSSLKGVGRFNGSKVRTYRLDDKVPFNHLGGRVIHVTAESKEVYAFDNRGSLFKFNVSLDRFELIAQISKKLGYEVALNDIQLTDRGIYLALHDGVYILTDNSFRQIVKGIYVNNIVATKDRLLFCAREGVFNEKGRKLLTYNTESAYYDELSGKLWLGGYENGLHVVTFGRDGRVSTDQFVSLTGGLIHGNPIRSICPYDDDTMLVGSDGEGVWQMSRDGRGECSLLFDANETNHGVLHGNGVYSMVVDSWKNIVIGTYSGGIDIARPIGSTIAIFRHTANDRETLSNDHVNTVMPLSDDLVLMGTDNGISIYNQTTGQWRHSCQGIVVLSATKHPDGTVLVSTYGKGIYVIDSQAQVRHIYTVNNSTLKDNHVYATYHDKNGNWWVGSLNGDLIQKSSSGVIRCYPIHDVQAITQLASGQIAIGTAFGLKLVTPDNDEIKDLNYAPAGVTDVNPFVTHLLALGPELWIATDGGGVYVYHMTKRQSRQLTVDNGLPSNYVRSLVKGKDGRIWIATDEGLAYVKTDESYTIVNVNYCYGLDREYSRGAVQNLPNGDIVFGSTTGAVVVHPEGVQPLNYKTKLVILGVNYIKSDNDLGHIDLAMVQEQRIYLSYSQRTFDVLFESVNMRHHYDISYRYKIDDGEWSQPTDQQSIRFVSMEPGRHLLTIQCTSRTCGEVVDTQQLIITIGRPWWNSWWMWCVYIALLLLTFWGAWRVYRLQEKYMRLSIDYLQLMQQVPSSSSASSPKELLAETDVAIEDNDSGRDFVDRATRLIVENLSDSEFSIDRLCREMAMSRTLFYVKLKSYTGKSPQDFIRIIRLEHAAALLRSGRSVTEVSALSGFDNPKYFSTVFKKYFGVSPSKYQ
ncbi:AraC-type DNA-binding protein [Xylanibacter ruminicola]|uniref:AraC-type DNA-binding protein n=1 Tax=Xylanibacter ruminicola TaxID=839 RepID=A0A1M6UES1_XYLRU|nr:AraC-type DNA-binding protein [Xylanibacter ruminicola]